MTKQIYDQHAAAFKNVEAYVILKDGERVATIAFKHPKDGAGRLYAYVHWFGVEMVRGYANGYGYDKRSAACEDAAQRIRPIVIDAEITKAYGTEGRDRLNGGLAVFQSALKSIGGNHWDNALRDAGFQVFQAV